MISSVAVIAPGAMGSAVAYRLSEHGIHVLTSLRGRGPQTLRRAAAAKMQDADDEAIARAMSFFPFCRRQRHLPWRNVSRRRCHRCGARQYSSIATQ